VQRLVAMGRVALRLEQVGRNSFKALAGRRVVGSASAWHDCNQRFCILQSYVRPDYRKRGVARALYEAIEASSGKVLAPATSLSDDGFEFWKRFRPESVAHDLRHVRDRLIGRPVEVKGQSGTVVSASGSVMTVEYAVPTERGSTTCVVVRSIGEALNLVGAAS